MGTDTLFRDLYPELRRIASLRARGERAGHTLQTTALLHEAYLRLSRKHSSAWENQAQFLAHASLAMRQILIEHARKRNRRLHLFQFDATEVPQLDSEADLIAFDRALDELSDEYARPATVLQLRFFLGLTVPEVAAAMSLSERTVKDDTRLGLAWLRNRLSNG
jgi:RNA polymerase sigma factor (TIGR02999 family)